ncbi:MAG: putative mannose-6-phosphate isomerase YvyI [candidate division BRC1 bacterium ADurb.BinA292]|nr:MAG: putative mannose-6-phosphate isomerase YvyI [candidate division BRC1 bacterium ADurb.BinA292]
MSAPPFERYPLLMQPFYSPRPWGGTRLAETLHKDVPRENGPYGEAWELSDHPDGRSTVANGPYAGRLFGDLVREYPRMMCGTERVPERFPLLVKYIDAAEDLSIQVHPSDATAPAGERGKTECWYIMDCAPGAELIYGLQPGVDAERLRAAVRANRVEQVVRRIRIRPGDFVYLPPGTVHAVLGGTLLCEVQQASNATYRLWDWDRKPARALHIEESLAVADYSGQPQLKPVAVESLEATREWVTLVRNDYFEVRTARWEAGELSENSLPNPHGLILNVVAGQGSLKVEGQPPQPLRLGQTWYLPAGLTEWALEAASVEQPVDEYLRVVLSESLELS